MSAPLKTSPASFDVKQLAETLDTMGLLVASLSDRIDAQGRLLEQVLQTATEARTAAFAAEKATDWKRNGDFINEGIARGTRQIDELVEVINTQIDLGNELFELMKPLLEERRLEALQRRKWSEQLRRCRLALLAGVLLVGVALALIGSHVVLAKVSAWLEADEGSF